MERCRAVIRLPLRCTSLCGLAGELCLDLDLRDAFPGEANLLGGSLREIEVPTWHIRPTVINLHLDGLARFQIGHGGLRPKRQRPMGSGQGVLIERLAARCFSAMETRSIPGGCADLGGRGFAVGSSFFCPVGQAQERSSCVRGGQPAVARTCSRLHPARHPSNVTPTMRPHASGVCTRDMVDSSSVTLVQGARLMPCRSRADEAISASVTRKEEAAQGRLPAQACGLRACHREGTEQPWHSTGRIGRWRVEHPRCFAPSGGGKGRQTTEHGQGHAPQMLNEHPSRVALSQQDRFVRHFLYIVRIPSF